MDRNDFERIKDNNKKKKASSSPRIVTMNELRNSEESVGQTYFAGGSIHSGQQILGADDRRENENVGNQLNLVQKMLEQFKISHGNSGQQRNSRNHQPFSCAGYRLGDSETANNSEAEIQPVSHTSHEPSQRTVTLKLWENGYTIDDGALESYEGLSSFEIINKIAIGLIPTNVPYNQNGLINLSVVDNTALTFRNSLGTFSGPGYVLGGLTPTLTSNVDGPNGEVPLIVSGESTNVKQRGDQSSANSNNENESFSSMDSMLPQPSCTSYVEEELLVADVPEDINGYDFEYAVEENDQSGAFEGQGYILNAEPMNTSVLDNIPSTDSSLEQLSSARLNRKFYNVNFKVSNNTNFSDGSEQIIMLKVRLPSGQTVKLTVNSSCNIHHIKEYLKICVPTLSNTTFSLQLIYPRRELKDEEMVNSEEIKNTVLNLRL